MARKLNDQSRKIDRLKSSRDSLKLQNARLDEQLDEISKKRRNLEDVARQIVSDSIRKVSLYVTFIAILIKLVTDCILTPVHRDYRSSTKVLS